MRQKLSRGGGQRRLIRRVYEETESLSMLGAKDKERGTEGEDKRPVHDFVVINNFVDKPTAQKQSTRISSSNLVYIQREMFIEASLALFVRSKTAFEIGVSIEGTL